MYTNNSSLMLHAKEVYYMFLSLFFSVLFFVNTLVQFSSTYLFEQNIPHAQIEQNIPHAQNTTHTATAIDVTAPLEIAIADDTHNLSVTPAARIIKINNAINDHMTRYKHWTGTYTPTTFATFINGIEIKGNQREVVQLTDKNTFIASFAYEFKNGYKQGAYEITYQVPEEITDLQMTFSWKDDSRIVFDFATPIKKEVVSFNQIIN